MKSFKEWCDEKYGIKGFSEGKIANFRFVPSHNLPKGASSKQLTPADGTIYELIMQKLKRNRGDIIDGFICSNETYLDPKVYPEIFEYKTPAPIFLKVRDIQKFNDFIRNYRLDKKLKADPSTGKMTFVTEPAHLEYLYQEYNDELFLHRQKNPLPLAQLEASEQIVSSLINTLKTHPQLETYLNKAHHISKDYSNDVALVNRNFEACSGYSISLQIYAELYKEQLTEEEYAALQHTIDILGRGQDQGLKTDANFMNYLVKNLGGRDDFPNVEVKGMIPVPSNKKEAIKWVDPITGKRHAIFNPIKDRAIYPELEAKINENIHNLLYGKEKVDWWGALSGKAPYKMRRFMPDAKMMSETNEITLQGGRMINHSAMFRIIKVGISRTGEVTYVPHLIHHFDYYHVQTNLGAEANEAIGDVCTGTYITKLEPTELRNDKILLMLTNPYADPKAYQAGMETTIQELIKTERHLCFYRRPQIGPNNEGASVTGSPEAEEWLRLKNRHNHLKGKPIGQEKLTYYSIGIDGKATKSTMKNQVNYIQHGGSCTIFSIKQLVMSILDTDFTSLHSNFLQQHDGKTQIAALNILLDSIQRQKALVQAKPQVMAPPQPKPQVISPDPGYFEKQMGFIDRFIQRGLTMEDLPRFQRIVENQKKQSIEFLDEFLSIKPGHELDTTNVGRFPERPKDIDRLKQYLAPHRDEIEGKDRRLSRYRLIYGPVDFYLGQQFDKPTTLNVITTCAPNLMGTSEIDLNEFSYGKNGVRELRDDAYEKECQKLAKFIVKTAKDKGTTKLVMPAYGVGVYISQLNDESKQRATEIMFKAFATAAFECRLEVDWVVHEGSRHAKDTQSKLSSFKAPNNRFMNAVISRDILEYAESQSQHGQVSVLNPGSDRTIGGNYTQENATPLEEQIAQQSDLVLLHTTFNGPMVRQFQDSFEKRKQQVLALKPMLNLHWPQVQNQNKNIELATALEEIGYAKVWVFDVHDKAGVAHKAFSFKDKNQAAEFSQNTQCVHRYPDGDYYKVILTMQQASNLLQPQQPKWTRSVPNSHENKALAKVSGFDHVWVYDLHDRAAQAHKEFSFKNQIDANKFASNNRHVNSYQDGSYYKVILSDKQAKELLQPQDLKSKAQHLFFAQAQAGNSGGVDHQAQGQHHLM